MIVAKEEFLNSEIPIIEIFKSISGEGVSAGNIVSFVRTAGCDLRCTWCDTKYSFKESGKGVEQLTPTNIAEQLKLNNCKEIICTGGEPLEHNKIKRYLPLFLQSQGFDVRIETSGGSSLYSVEELNLFGLDNTSRPVYTMDVKCPDSGMSKSNIFENITLLDERDELKFVLASENDFEYAKEVIERFKLHISSNSIPLNFSPVFESLPAIELTELLKDTSGYFEENNLNARLSLQIHKFIWPPHQRGV